MNISSFNWLACGFCLSASLFTMLSGNISLGLVDLFLAAFNGYLGYINHND